MKKLFCVLLLGLILSFNSLAHDESIDGVTDLIEELDRVLEKIEGVVEDWQTEVKEPLRDVLNLTSYRECMKEYMQCMKLGDTHAGKCLRDYDECMSIGVDTSFI